MIKQRSYKELVLLNGIQDRFEYLKLGGFVGVETFGYDRYLNQVLYRSKEWRDFRHHIIVRDNACDLGVEGFEIYGSAVIHHLNPITKKDIEERSSILFDEDNVITTTLRTHNAIHYGDESILPKEPVQRFKGDTCPWKL